MDAIKRYYFVILSIFPLLQFLFYEYFNRGFVLLYGAIGTVLFLAILLSGKKLKYPKFIIPLIILTVYYFIWNLINGNISGLESGVFSYLYTDLWLHTIAFLILVENTKFDDRFIQDVIKVFKVTVILAFVVSLVQFLIDPFFLAPDSLKIHALSGSQYDYRLPSIFGYIAPTEIGLSFIPIISILIGYYLYKGERLHFTWLIMAGLSFFVNKSRYLYLNFLIILTQYPIVNGFNLKKILNSISIGTVFLLVVILIMKSIGFYFEEFIQNRLLSSSASTRLLAFQLFFEFFPKNPFFGSGIHVGEDLSRAIGGRSSQIHVGYISHLYEFGIVGSIFLFTFWYQLWQKFHAVAKRTMYYGSLFAFLAFLATNVTGVFYSIYSYGLLFAFIFNKYVNDQHQEDNL